MKKIIICLLTLLFLFGCSNSSTPEPEEEPVEEEPVIEPVGYFGPFYLEAPSKVEVESLAEGGKIALQGGEYGTDYNDYFKEVLAEYGITEDNYVYVDSYNAIPAMIYNNEIDAWIMDPSLAGAVSDFWPFYQESDYVTLMEINVPYYEEIVENKEITEDPLFTEPFIVYCAGIDESVDPSTTRGVRTDVNIVMVVDPVKRHVLTVSFPRDSYVRGTKVNALVQGKNGTMTTAAALGDLLDVEIPYYAQESFSSFLIMVNYIGGVRVDVPMNVHMDQDSKRNVKQPYNIDKGEDQLLLGEEALALCRNRKYNGIVGGDFGRIRNQILVVNSLIEKFAKYPKLVDFVGMDWLYPYIISTNFTDEQMHVLFELAKTFHEGYTVDNYFISCYDDNIDGAYIARIYSSSLAVAKGKVKLAMTGEIDENSKYYDSILTGYVSKGAGTSKDGGYLGDEYDLREVYGIEEETEEVDTETEEGSSETGNQ